MDDATPELSLVYSANGRPVVFPIPQGSCTLGSATDNDLILKHPSVKAHQAIIQRDGGELLLRDLFSGDTRVNSEPRRNGPLVPGDVLTLGDVRLRIMKVAPRKRRSSTGLFDAPDRTGRFTRRSASEEASERLHLTARAEPPRPDPHTAPPTASKILDANEVASAKAELAQAELTQAASPQAGTPQAASPQAETPQHGTNGTDPGDAAKTAQFGKPELPPSANGTHTTASEANPAETAEPVGRDSAQTARLSIPLAEATGRVTPLKPTSDTPPKSTSRRIPRRASATEETQLLRERDAKRARAIARARQLSDDLRAETDFELILERTALAFLEIFDADRTVTILLEEDGRNPLLTVERRRDGTDDGTGVSQEIIDRCLEVRSVLRIAGAQKGLDGLAAPLTTGKKTLGLLYFERFSPRGHDLEADDVHLLSLMTNLCALVLSPLV